ncbi:hypothetical protein ACFL03_03110 [Thermodesulfobacteriota bacterium]
MAGGGRLGSRGVPTVAHQSDLQRKTAKYKDRGQPLKPTVFFYLKSEKGRENFTVFFMGINFI